LCAEYLEQTPPSWQGEIKHIKSEEVMRFVDLGKMLEFIEGLTVKLKERKYDETLCMAGLWMLDSWDVGRGPDGVTAEPSPGR
jgi:hypothetical protein